MLSVGAELFHTAGRRQEDTWQVNNRFSQFRERA
jgi:hypothetical protein